MSKRESINYEKLTPNDIKIIVTSGNESTEVVARVLERGSYTICDSSYEERKRKNNTEPVSHSKP